MSEYEYDDELSPDFNDYETRDSADEGLYRLNSSINLSLNLCD